MNRPDKPKSSDPQAVPYVPQQIVSGGQTGVDRAGLDVAIAIGIAHGGWCPAGRLAEDGSVPSRYELRETDSSDYPARTKQNVIDSDATLILFEQALKGGTRLTKRYCQEWQKPHFVVEIQPETLPRVRDWLKQQQPNILNIAGPRESTYPGIYERAFQYLLKVFTGF